MLNTPVEIDDISSVHIEAAAERQLTLTKPPGSLGYLEEIGNRLCGIFAQVPPPALDRVDVAVFAGDHGVAKEGVTPWPQEVTVQMLANFIGGGAGINVIADVVGANVLVVDVGVAADTTSLEGLVQRKQVYGTKSLVHEAAMSLDESVACFNVGYEVATELIGSGSDLLVTGDMGIGNTTSAAAIISVITGALPSEVVGRGTGIDDAMLKKKIEVVTDAIDRTIESGCVISDPFALLSHLGGAEIAAIAGYIVGAASRKRPVLVDGVISLAGALAATLYNRAVSQYLFVGHLSTEPGAAKAVEYLGVRPILSLDMRLGEGTGATLAVSVLKVAAKVLIDMATFDQAGVSQIK